MANKIRWEVINDEMGITYRAEVIGGWLIRYHTFQTPTEPGMMVFVPDPHHSWKRKEALNNED